MNEIRILRVFILGNIIELLLPYRANPNRFTALLPFFFLIFIHRLNFRNVKFPIEIDGEGLYNF